MSWLRIVLCALALLAGRAEQASLVAALVAAGTGSRAPRRVLSATGALCLLIFAGSVALAYAKLNGSDL